MVAIRYSIQDLETKAALKQTERRLSRPEKALKECGLVLLRSISKNFKAGGRPERWRRSWRALYEGGCTLIDTGMLKNSINFRFIGKKKIAVGTPVKYARIHQLGGRIDKNVTVKNHYRYITKAFGRPIKGRKVLVRKHQRKMDTHIHARPFLMVQPEDMRVMKRIVADYTTGR